MIATAARSGSACQRVLAAIKGYLPEPEPGLAQEQELAPGLAPGLALGQGPGLALGQGLALGPERVRVRAGREESRLRRPF